MSQKGKLNEVFFFIVCLGVFSREESLHLTDEEENEDDHRAAPHPPPPPPVPIKTEKDIFSSSGETDEDILMTSNDENEEQTNPLVNVLLFRFAFSF